MPNGGKDRRALRRGPHPGDRRDGRLGAAGRGDQEDNRIGSRAYGRDRGGMGYQLYSRFQDTGAVLMIGRYTSFLDTTYFPSIKGIFFIRTITSQCSIAIAKIRTMKFSACKFNPDINFIGTKSTA